MSSVLVQKQKELFDLGSPPPKSNLLRWAGSKASCAGKVGQWIDFERPYFEPFCGSAAVYFHHQPKMCRLNDANPKLISFYKQLSMFPEQVWAWYNAQPIEEDHYYAVRARYNDDQEPLIEAAMFLFLNHFGYNGVYRTNMRGKLNTPYGAKSKPKRKLSLSELTWFADRIPKGGLTSLDFEEVLEAQRPAGASIFFDPPYYTSDTRVFSEYGEQVFKLKDLHRLLKLSERLSRNNLVVVSYRDCSEFRELFASHVVDQNTVLRSVSATARERKKETELIAVLGE